MSLEIRVVFSDPMRTVYYTHDNNHYTYKEKYTNEFKETYSNVYWYRVFTEDVPRENKYFLAQINIYDSDTHKYIESHRCYYK